MRRFLPVAALLAGVAAPKAASAVQSSEFYRTQAYLYGRFEARIQYAPGDGAVSTFFLWKDGSSATTTWNELDFEKINAACRMQTNIWTGKGTQSFVATTPAFNICAEYHTYAIEWTPDYIAWFIDGAQLRRVTGASVTEYTQNAAQGMTIHFNLWAGDASFGGVLNPSILPVRQYISWAQYSSYANGAFQVQWREEFNGSTVPTGWAVGTWASPFSLSTHNAANVTFVNGIAVLSMTADNATGYTGTPPADPMSPGTGGAPGTGGRAGTGGSGTGGAGTGTGGSGGAGGVPGSGGRLGTGGSTPPGSGGASSAAGSNGTAGRAGNGTGGGVVGTGGSGAGGPVGSGGAVATGGTSATGSGGAAAIGGAMGTGAAPPGGPGAQSPPADGCSCSAAGGGVAGGGGLFTMLLLAVCARRRNRGSRNGGSTSRGSLVPAARRETGPLGSHPG